MEGFNQETDEFLEEEDLLLQQSDREENVLQFLQALNLQVIGACRADERLIPLLKINVSNSPAEDRLLAHLIQHFEAQEIEEVKVVSYPRGNLNLTLLPSSNLRISFTGNDGCSERLATLSSNCKNAVVMIEEISADTSGRSFVVKLPRSRAYFWCSEKSMLLGNDLLAKMTDVLMRKPSLAELTGISESRLDCFAVHFREYLLGSTVSNIQTNQIATPVTTLDTASEPSELDSNFQVSSSLPKLSFPQANSNQVLKAHSYSDTEDLDCASAPIMGVSNISSTDNKKPSEGSIPSLSLGFLGKSTSLSSPDQLLQGLPSSKDPAAGPYFSSPYYCLCPPCTSTSQYAEVPPSLTNSFAEPFLLPPLSSLLSGSRSLNPFATLKPPHNLVDVTSFDLSAFLSDPMVQVPLSISLATMSTSQQIPTFTPFICDPIVHIPAVGVCSSGQGYVVGSGHAVPTTIPHVANPLIPDPESMVEKGARETLQLLLNSTQANPWSRDVLPAFLTSAGYIHEHDMLDEGSHYQCHETTEVDTFANGIGVMELAVQPQKRRHGGDIDSSNQSAGSGDNDAVE